MGEACDYTVHLGSAQTSGVIRPWGLGRLQSTNAWYTPWRITVR